MYVRLWLFVTCLVHYRFLFSLKHAKYMRFHDMWHELEQIFNFQEAGNIFEKAVLNLVSGQEGYGGIKRPIGYMYMNVSMHAYILQLLN